MCFFGSNSSGQVWSTIKGGNAFDGEYIAAMVLGDGYEFPYLEPYFVVNYYKSSQSLYIYLVDAGYSGCDNRYVYVKFDTNDTTYVFRAGTNPENDKWMFEEMDGLTSLATLVQMMKKYSKAYVRISSDCGSSDFDFTLRGSSRALDQVIPANYFKERKKVNARSDSLKSVNYNTHIKLGDEMVDRGAYDSAIVEYQKAGKYIPNGYVYKAQLRKAQTKKKLQESGRLYKYSGKTDSLRTIKSGTNLYSERDEFSHSLRNLPSGTVVKVLEDSNYSNEYIKVEYDGVQGYITKRALK